MWDFVITHVLPTFIAVGAGWFAKRVGIENEWGKVREVAKVIAKDPERTSDPKQAMAEALVAVQLERLSKEAEKVLAAFNTPPMPGIINWSDGSNGATGKDHQSLATPVEMPAVGRVPTHKELPVNVERAKKDSKAPPTK
jgi:hypothetical protein